MVYRLWVLLIVALLPIPAQAAPKDADEALAWVARMADALHRLDYAGTFVYRHGNTMQSMRIVHANRDGVESERLISLSGPMREISRSGSVVSCVVQDGDPLIVDPTPPAELLPRLIPANPQLMANYYEVKVADAGRVAGMPARKIILIPRDNYRYGQNLWIDSEHGLLLHSQLLGEDNEVIEELLFTEITVFDSVPEELLQLESNGTRLQWNQNRRPDNESVSESPWALDEPLAGFQRIVHERHVLDERGGKEVEHIVYSDGLASVSVFIERVEEAVHEPQITQHGGLNIRIDQIGDTQLTTLGEVPMAAINKVASALMARRDRAQP